MNGWMTVAGYMLADYLLASTLLLTVVLAVMGQIEQPARRRVLARTALVALAVLLLLEILPGWPRLAWLGGREANSPRAQLVDEEAAGMPAGAVVPGSPRAEGEWGEAANASAAASAPSDSNPVGLAPDRMSAAWASPWLPSWPAVVAIGLGGVAGAVGLWLLQGAVRLELLRRRAVEAPAALEAMLAEVAGGARRRPRLLMSAEVASPVALGVVRPAILLPSRYALDDADAIRTALGHEWAHIRNGDLAYRAMLFGLLPLLALHPLYWKLRRRIGEDQEILADAAACGADRSRYAAGLLRWARWAVESPPARLGPVLGMSESPGQLSRRIAMLLDERSCVETHCPRRWRWLAAIGMLAMILSTLTLRPIRSAESTAKAPSENTEPLTCACRVSDHTTGQPIAGATVLVKHLDSAQWDRLTVLAEQRYQTDAEGRYTMTIPPEVMANRSAFLEGEVSHPDYMSRGGAYSLGMIRRNAKVGQRPFFEHWRLLAAEQVSGTVLTPEGKPAAGIQVVGSSVDSLHNWGSSQAATDSHGVFRLKLGKGVPSVLSLLPKDYAPLRQVVGDKRGDLGRFTLPRGAVIQGRLVDEQGQPVSAVWVNALMSVEPAKGAAEVPAGVLVRSAQTDQAGRFVMAPLPPGECLVRVEDRPYESVPWDHIRRLPPAPFPPQTLTLEAGENRSLEFRAAPQVLLEGQYYDSLGKPCGGYEPSLLGMLGGERFSVWGEVHQGRFVIRAPKGLQQARLDIVGNEHEATRVRLAKGGPLHKDTRDIPLGTLDKDLPGIEVVLYRAPMLVAKPVAEDGGTLKDVRVKLAYSPGNGQERPGHIELQQDGRWRSLSLQPDEEFVVTAEAAGYQPASQKLRLPEGAVHELELKLSEK